jgi:hypothetical protein
LDRACSTHKRNKKHIIILVGNVKGSNHLRVLDVDGVIIRWVFKK